MLLLLLAYLGGALTIVSPCSLPELPFVFARADRAFVRSGLPSARRALVDRRAASVRAVVLVIRQTGPIRERTFEIRFLDPGVHAYAFTFG